MAEEYKAVTICIKSAGHEQLDELKGGDEEGHYHLSGEEYDDMLSVLERYRDEEESGETFYKLRESEYNRLIELLDLLYPTDDDNPEQILTEIIAANTSTYVTEHDIIDGGEVLH